MLNVLEIIRSIPTAKLFDVGGLLFAQFQCPQQEDEICVWTQTDHLLHMLSGKASWRTVTGTVNAKAGESIFFKKGAYIFPQHFDKNLCVEVFFLPDDLIKTTVMELAPNLPVIPAPVNPGELTIRVNNDVTLSAFFQAMTTYFAADEEPPEALLNLKLKELLASILLGTSNPALSAYFRSIAASNTPSISAIMETNFCRNLSIEAFAQICHRSVSSFKREFRKHYNDSPGKWLLERRLQHSALLLQQSNMSVTEIAFESGFQDLSHFSRAFKKKFGRPPSEFRETASVTA